MPKVTFVIGATASGKTYYINHNFADKNVEILNIYDYQQKAYEESGFYHKQMMPIPVQFRCLMNANDDLLSDIIENLKQGFVLLQNDIDLTEIVMNAANGSNFEDEIKETNLKLKKFSNSESPEIPLQFIFREKAYKYLHHIRTITLQEYFNDNDNDISNILDNYI